MNDLLRRRRAMMEKKTDVLDTSPRIAEYGKHCNRSNEGLTENELWCYTDWYDFPKPHGNITYQQLTGMDGSHTFQEINTDTGERTWNYPKISIASYYDKVRFSIKISLLRTCYFIRNDTGEIIFAGRDSIYYGHKNISEIT